MKQPSVIRSNNSAIRARWGGLDTVAIRGLNELVRNHGFSIFAGDLTRLDGKWYVTHTGLYCWHAQKQFYTIHFAVLEPRQFSNSAISGRIYCSAKALWKLSWFLRDFGYDAELLGRDELEEKCLVGLSGVVKITHTTVRGTSLLNLDGFAPAARWEELSGSSARTGSEVA